MFELVQLTDKPVQFCCAMFAERVVDAPTSIEAGGFERLTPLTEHGAGPALSLPEHAVRRTAPDVSAAIAREEKRRITGHLAGWRKAESPFRRSIPNEVMNYK
jgi:hypothetical protein